MTIVKCCRTDCNNNDCGICTKSIIELYETQDWDRENILNCYYYKR